MGSTVLDFAFAVHTDIGLRFKSALVNGQIKPISFMPQMGDVITINTFKNRYSANKHRLDFIHTSGAKNNLTKFLKVQQKDDILKQMTSDLNDYLQSLGLATLWSQADLIGKKYTKEEIEKILLSVFDKKENFS
jgi:(p)ppGpp synthase/HD superfamily hydrolase